MTIVINLPNYLFQCPAAWRNMIHAMHEEHDMYEVTPELIQEEVGQYGGVYNEDKSVLTFKSKEDYEFWRLKWM